MSANLRLVVNHPGHATRRHDGGELRLLAKRLMEHIRTGSVGFARALVENEHLLPIERGIIATLLIQSGVSESQILAVMAGQPSPTLTPSARRSAAG